MDDTEPPSVWQDVPDNILLRVAAYLPCRRDRVRFSSANKHWRRALLGHGEGRPSQLPPMPMPLQLPWLIFPSTEAPSFFCETDRVSHPLPLPPDVRMARFCGSFDGGWLLLSLDRSHRHALYNLNSGARIPLPSGINVPREADNSAPKNLPLVLRAAALSSPPSLDSKPYIVGAIALVDTRWCPAFWSHGSQSWFTHGAIGWGRQPLDVIYYSGCFYFITTGEDVVVYWPGFSPSGELEMNRLDYDMYDRDDYELDLGYVRGDGSMKYYLVESRGSLHMVVRYIFGNGGTEYFRVFLLNIMAPAARGLPPRAAWMNLLSLDGRMLLLGRGCSRSFEAAHAQFDGFEDSIIYFPDDRFILEKTVDRRYYSFTDMGKYSVGIDSLFDSWQPWPPLDRRPARSDNAPPTWWFH